MKIADLLAAIARPGASSPEAPEFLDFPPFTVPDVWKQGRTCYGGLSAAIAYWAGRQAAPDLPPLRSVQIAFVGPLSDHVSIETQLLRRGRNTAFIEVLLKEGDHCGLSALLLFASSRPSTATLSPPVSPVPHPEALPAQNHTARSFFKNFDYVSLSESSAPGIVSAWVRLRERGDLPSAFELLLVGDALPPAAFRLMSTLAPISSMTWQLDLLTDPPTTEDGWWRLESVTTQAGDGCSSQRMSIWNRAGTLVASGMQSVALFG